MLSFYDLTDIKWCEVLKDSNQEVKGAINHNLTSGINEVKKDDPCTILTGSLLKCKIEKGKANNNAFHIRISKQNCII
ncbi:conserved hypothetical protein [Bacillus sp. 349Y]|nr:conserved hypothetical protein [Bacillus sp. 349Y]